MSNPLLEVIAGYERQVWDALVSGDAAADARLLSDDFLGVYSVGFARKQDHTDQLKHGPSIQTYALESLTLRRLGQEHAMLSYRASFRRTRCSTDEAMYVTSLWQRNGESWINVFSQDTPEAR